MKLTSCSPPPPPLLSSLLPSLADQAYFLPHDHHQLGPSHLLLLPRAKQLRSSQSSVFTLLSSLLAHSSSPPPPGSNLPPCAKSTKPPFKRQHDPFPYTLLHRLSSSAGMLSSQSGGPPSSITSSSSSAPFLPLPPPSSTRPPFSPPSATTMASSSSSSSSTSQGPILLSLPSHLHIEDVYVQSGRPKRAQLEVRNDGPDELKVELGSRGGGEVEFWMEPPTERKDSSKS